jgi:hypothetical protein
VNKATAVHLLLLAIVGVHGLDKSQLNLGDLLYSFQLSHFVDERQLRRKLVAETYLGCLASKRSQQIFHCLRDTSLLLHQRMPRMPQTNSLP